MTIFAFNELKNQVKILNDQIFLDMRCDNDDYNEEFITFSRHLLSTKNWFLRLSWANKRLYVLVLLEDLRSAWALSLLLKSLWNCRPKDAVLSASQIHPWSVYDVAPLDHNRTAVPILTLGQVMTDNRKWFYLLSPELQALVLAELLMISGGPIMWEALSRGQKIYTIHHESQLRDLMDCIVVEQNKEEKGSGKVETQTTSAGYKEKKRASISISEEDIPYQSWNKPRLSLTSPQIIIAQNNLEVSLNVWNNTIKSIRDCQKLEELEMTFKDGNICKIWKVNRVKPEAIETVDFVQLLPSAIGKRILSYLPRASLQDYSRVNKYWAYLVDELKVELATNVKLCVEKQKLKDIMLKHDKTLENSEVSDVLLMGSLPPSTEDQSTRRVQMSYKVSERSTGAVSFRQLVADKLKPTFQKDEEGVLGCFESHFPSPLMKHRVKLPLILPLCRDPALSTAVPKTRHKFSYGPMDMKSPNQQKRYRLWSRDHSGLLNVLKVPSYNYH